MPLFLRKVARFLKTDLSGRWFCKMEFQRGGWVHWHLIVLDVEHIPHAAVTRCWGHGHVWLRRLTQRAVKYTTKYVTKEDGFPMWLLSERPRSVKFIRVSPGFWGDLGENESEQPHDDDGSVESGDTPSPDDTTHVVDLSAACYVPIGERVSQHEHRILAKDDRGRFCQVDAEMGALLAELLMMSRGVVGRRQGWLVVDATLDDLRHAAGRVAAASAAATAALHSNETRNPDGRVRPCALPWWVDEWFRQEARASWGLA
ncbi:MAG: hypothetical protein IT433_08285 [Phycisphaerales bacterium]|nr:hypothetical protein [Phycisphaerales bacterium]